ncbi:hypothetical protein [Pseudovibrio sp. POLY-S9]|uniref:hypothetical protein n=1 Tax=Pseudovibrio sp. POLY-S9 TaxID=1576596 RepID=UPI00070C8812|nr:hypothetical protein [Pseudovibrio sp. POLY-S9]
MNPIEQQRKVIDQVYHMVSGSCPQEATSANCRFEYLRFDDGSASVEEQFNYVVKDKTISTFLDRRLSEDSMILIKELHSLMKAQTGGDWNAFTLTINEDGSVATKFEYPDKG